MAPPADLLTATILVLSVLAQGGAALVAFGQMRLAGRYRYAWLAVTMALVLMVQRRAAALWILFDAAGDQFSSALVGLAISLLMLVGVVGLRALFADMRAQERELVRLATIDALTQIPNRRHTLDLARREFLRQQRTLRPLVVMELDLDHFKTVNDTHGHAVGDAVLKAVSSACRDAMRNMDIFGRLGGEEFMVLLPETGIEQALATAERLRARIAGLEIATDHGILAITASIGLVVADTPSAEPDGALTESLHRADTALYSAKSAGRNRCTLWRGESMGMASSGPGDPPPASP